MTKALLSVNERTWMSRYPEFYPEVTLERGWAIVLGPHLTLVIEFALNPEMGFRFVHAGPDPR